VGRTPNRWILAPALLVIGLPHAARGQDGTCGRGVAPVDLEMLLEKTIFNVDVLTLSVSLGGPHADSLRSMAPEEKPTRQVEDSVALMATRSTCADSELEFLRNVSLGQFIDAIRNSSRAAHEAGFIESETYELIDGSLQGWYAFLDGRGVRDGDRMSYRIRGDTLGILYRASDGAVLLDQTEIDAARRQSVLAGYFAPGSDFRDGLMESFFSGQAGSAERPSTSRGGDGR
jgi:hypothetical protein